MSAARLTRLAGRSEVLGQPRRRLMRGLDVLDDMARTDGGAVKTTAEVEGMFS